MSDVAVPVLSCRNLEVGYGRTGVLWGTALDVTRGETVSVMGTSGSGKSTLLLTAAGLLPPTKGTVQVADTDLYALAPDDRTAFRRRHVGLVLQFGQLVDELTLVDNVAFPLLLSGVKRAPAGRQGRALLGEVGLAGLEGRYPSQVSGGQRQRAAIARALITEPDVVLADEPTGSLDEATSNEVLDLILHETRTAGAALVLVTHDATVASRADRHVHLDGGVLVESQG